MGKRLLRSSFKLAENGLFAVKFSLLKQKWKRGSVAVAAWRKIRENKNEEVMKRGVGFEEDMSFLERCFVGVVLAETVVGSLL